MTETTTLTRPGISWYTAPGISMTPQLKKETLDKCIARVFDIPEVYLNVKGRYIVFMYPKHLRRYILERTLESGEMADNDWTRINVKNGKKEDYGVIQQNSRPGYWRVRFRRDGRRYERSGYASKQEAIFDRDLKLREFKMAWFKYSIEQVALMSGCERCTVIHSISECKALMETDRIYREKCLKVIEKLNNNLLILPEWQEK